jgi:nitrate/TMAO reductase-like tetraheme cytochrome c subunit
METTEKPPETDEIEPEAPESPGTWASRALSRVRSLGPRARIVAGMSLMAVVIVLAMAADAGASSPVVCSTCHEMKPWVASWSVSAHAQVGCSSCHATPRPWYGAPLAAFDRWGRLRREFGSHWADPSREVTAGSVGASAVIPDSTCEQCHDPARTGTSRFGVQIKHAEHAERNKSCVSCHRYTAHAPTTGSRDSLMMLLCFDCHGLAKTAKAPGRCDLCHLKGVDLRPAFHKTGKWLTTHGPASKVDREQCAMCHYQKFCDDCHGLQMPHPAGWAKGRKGHAVIAAKDRQVCAKCHKGNADLCTMCHHKGFDDRKGPWVKQHPAMASQTGTSFCFQCHGSVFCARCHTTGSR